MKKNVLITAVLLFSAAAFSLGFHFGVPDAVKQDVKELDEKKKEYLKPEPPEPPEPPEIKITSPEDGATVSGTVEIQTSVTAKGRSVAKVEFYINNKLKYSDYEAPYTWNWDTTEVNDGEQAVKAVVIDMGNYWAQDTASVVVDNIPPTVTITSPVDDRVLACDFINIKITASGDPGIGETKLYIDGKLEKTWNGSGEKVYEWSTAGYNLEEGAIVTVKAVTEDTEGGTAEDEITFFIIGMPYIDYSGYKLYIHPSDFGTKVWGGEGTVTNATSTVNGAWNTSEIVDTLGEGDYAAYVCYSANAYGYDDWYLPAKDQLVEMYNKRNDVVNSGIDEWNDFGDLCYWSSTEDNASYAWVVNFVIGYVYSYVKDVSIYVRPVRGGPSD